MNKEEDGEDPFWEAIQFDNEEFTITKSIVARGQFGASYMLGKIRHTRPLPPKLDTKVMMKRCKSTDRSFHGLKSELNILYDLCHTNVIHLIGYSSEGEQANMKIVLVFEYCANGNLIKTLQKGRPHFNIDVYSPKKAINNEILSPDIFLTFSGKHLLAWALHLARGMDYLAFKGVVHGDLSARNVLLTCDWTAKICNFGISQRQNIQDESYAKQLPKDVLPLAWMAPEAIQSLNLTEKSDVWSYGITLWEIFTLGGIPYVDDNVTIDERFWTLLLQDVRPSKPKHANEHIWDLITSCWAFHDQKRPTFSTIKTFLEKTVRATESQLDTNLSGLSDEPSSSSTTASKANVKKKLVTFAPQVPGALIRKCFAFKDDILYRQRRDRPSD